MSGAGVTVHRFSYPCRFKKREDGSYFIRFPDLPEAIVDLVEETDLHRSAHKCLASVRYWRITNEIEVPSPSPPRDGQPVIELSLVQALSDTIARGRSALSDTDGADESSERRDASVEREPPPFIQNRQDQDIFEPIAVAAE